MITTVCVNPSFDRTVTVDQLEVGGTNRILSSRTDLGGKGINVAVVLHSLGIPVKCFCIAGRTGRTDVEAFLKQKEIPHYLIDTDGAVRTNLKVVSLACQGVTEINEPGPVVDPVSLHILWGTLGVDDLDQDFLVLTGSLPPGCPKDYYAQLINGSPGLSVLDASGEALRQGVKAEPFLVKPNVAELEQLLGRKLPTLADIRSGAEEVREMGAWKVLVSMGAEGALMVTDQQTLFAPGLRVEVKSTVGAGDAMLAGLLAAYDRGLSDLEALRHAVAAGTASVMTEGTQLIERDNYERLLADVVIQEL